MKTSISTTQLSLARLTRIFGIGSSVLVRVSSVALVAMIVVVAGDVMLRNVFGVAVTGVAETVTQWLMPITVLFALAYAERRQEHIKVTVVEESMNGLPHQIVTCLGQLVAVIIALIMAFGSIELAIHSFGIRETVPMGTGQLAIWPVKIAIVPGWIWLVLQGLVTLLSTIFPNLREVQRGDEAEREDAKMVGGISA